MYCDKKNGLSPSEHLKHCAIITAYKDLNQILRLLSRLPTTWGIFIHIDRKSLIKIEELQNSCSFVDKKFKIYWGGINHLYAILYLLREAHAKNYNYYHILTGQDYPLFRDDNSLDSLIDFDNKIYLQYFKLPANNWWGDGLDILRYSSLGNYFDIRTCPGKILNYLLRKGQEILGILNELPNYPIYAGLVYCSLPDYAVDFVLNSTISKDLLRRIRYSLPAEEIFFQTILMNSPYSGRIVNNNLRFCEWDINNSPKELDINDFFRVINSKAIFIRKVGLKSKELLARIDSAL